MQLFKGLEDVGKFADSVTGIAHTFGRVFGGKTKQRQLQRK